MPLETGTMSTRKKNNSYRYFQNSDCEYFPCHKINNTKNFNCLFCFCPLFYYCKNRINGIVKCEDCTLPHLENNYELVIFRINMHEHRTRKK